jgi:acetyl-CoA C-acetyltransferase
MTNVVILDGVRTAIGSFGGSLKEFAPTELGALIAAEAIKRAGIAPDQIDQSFFGHVIHTETRDAYISRVAAVNAGVPVTSPALTVNRLCGSGLQAIVSGTQAIRDGDATTVLCGGVEVMSRAPHATQDIRWGKRLGNPEFNDMLLGALSDPFGHGHMGITGENIAKEYDISREAQDAFSLESHQRAERAQKEGRFDSQILPIESVKRGKTTVFDKDEHIRYGAVASDFSSLRPAFCKDGTVTAGNASGINDAAAAIVIMDGTKAKEQGLKPRAKIVGYALGGVAPEIMGTGPIPAVKRLLAKTGLSVDDLDVIESNEAFASQVCSVTKALGLDPAKVNPNGGAVALGHPVGATGVILIVKLMAELERIDGHYGLATMCIGGGQGIAIAIERI